MTGAASRSLRVLVEQHQVVHELLDAAAGLRGQLLDCRIPHRCDVGAELIRAPRHGPGLAQQVAIIFGEGASVGAMPWSVMATIVLSATSPTTGVR